MSETTEHEAAMRQQVPHERVVSCEHCDDGDGHSVFPYYGVAPHANLPGGGTRLLFAEDWPDNFDEDPECPGCGTYTHCPVCGAR